MKWTHVAVLATAGPNDGLRDGEKPRPLVMAGRWVFDIVVGGLAQGGYDVRAETPSSTGNWVLSVGGKRRRFKLVLSDISPVLVCEIMESRTIGEWLRRAPRDPECGEALKVVCAALQADSRVREVLAFSGPKPEGVVFVGESIEKLERALGIYSR